MAVSEDGGLVVSASDLGLLRVWDIESGLELRAFRSQDDLVLGMALSNDGKHVVSVSADKTLKVWDVRTGHEVRNIESQSGGFTSVAVSWSAQRAAAERVLVERELTRYLATPPATQTQQIAIA